MIICDVEQGTDEWLGCRLGIPTASVFDKIITPTGKLSSSAGTLMNKLIYEWLSGKPADNEVNDWMTRGHEVEPEARDFYEFQNATEVKQVGFVQRDNKLAGCSPDGLVGDDGLLEIKCPSGGVHVSYMLNGFPGKYNPQVQGQMWVCEREWCDFLSYHPDLSPVLIRVARDDDYIKKLSEAMDKFINQMLEKRETLTQRKAA